MSEPTRDVLRFEDHLDRRSRRLEIAEALVAGSPRRLALVRHLNDLATVASAERAAVVWVDEYKPGQVHPHVVLDLRSDRPRRSFPSGPLGRVRELGIPSVLDEPATSTTSGFLSVALGSDGARSWFVVAESAAPRPALDIASRERAMYVAGECAAVVLHSDLDVSFDAEVEDRPTSRFPGWPILEDIDISEAAGNANPRITKRFTIGRLTRMFIENDLSLNNRLVGITVDVRADIAELEYEEAVMWHRVLDAIESPRLDELAQSILELGGRVEAEGHSNGALELYSCAYDVAAATGLPGQAVDAARFSGRTLRRLGRFSESRAQYSLAKAVALAAGDLGRAARAFAGTAAVFREQGNTPAARSEVAEARELATASKDKFAQMSVYAELVSVEVVSNNLPEALSYGWKAVTMAEAESDRMRYLAVLASQLEKAGEWSAAEDAWTLVAERSGETYYQIYAWDALAYLAALKGDDAAFEVRSARCDALGWEDGQRSAAAEILTYRGLSYRALGRLDEARAWLTRAVGFAEEHGFGRALFEADEALKSLDSPEEIEAKTPREVAAPEIRVGLREMRAEAVGSAP